MYEFVIIGGGIAGVTCVQRLSSLVETTKEKILLISASPLVKAATNIKSVTKLLQDFDVEEKPIETFSSEYPNVTIVHKFVIDLDSKEHRVICNDGSSYEYKKLCICAGGSPKVIASNNPHVIGIRDTETVVDLQKRLQNARQILIVGNGGIATELVYEIEHCKILWAIKDDFIGHTFFDSTAARFFQDKLNAKKEEEPIPAKRTKYTITKYDAAHILENKKASFGSALGPDWSSGLSMRGLDEQSHSISIEYKCEIQEVLSNEGDEWPVYARLTNGRLYGCDFIISATGITPNLSHFTKNNKIELASDGGVLVDKHLKTSIDDIYAAGDICSAGWEYAPHWFQMKLWSQARQMGDYVARSMYASLHNQDGSMELDFCFELFAHITKFFNYKCIFLGKYNAQGLGNDYELLLRTTPGLEFIKLVMHHGRVAGAILIGETDLEETFENLILNQIDVSMLGEDLLNPSIDIEDYFD